MTAREVQLQGGPPWGFRMHGGTDQGQPLRISRVNPGSRAASQGVREGDVITAIDGQPTAGMTNADAHQLLRCGGPTLRMGLNDSSGGPIKRRGSLRRSSETNNNSSKAANKHGEKEATGPGRRRGGRGVSKSRSDPELAREGRVAISSSRARRLRKYRCKMRRAQELQRLHDQAGPREEAEETHSASASRRGSAESIDAGGAEDGSIDGGGGATPLRGGSLPLEVPRRLIENPLFDDEVADPGQRLSLRWRRSTSSLSSRNSPDLDDVEGLESFVIIVTEETDANGEDGDVTIKEIEEIVVDVGSMTPKTPDWDGHRHPLDVAAGAQVGDERRQDDGDQGQSPPTAVIAPPGDTRTHSNPEDANDAADTDAAETEPGATDAKKGRRPLRRYPSIVEAYLDHKIKQYEIAIQRLDSPVPPDEDHDDHEDHEDRPDSPLLLESSASVEELPDDSWEFAGELQPLEAATYFVREFDVDEAFCPFEFPTATSVPQHEAVEVTVGNSTTSTAYSTEAPRAPKPPPPYSLEVIEEEPSEHAIGQELPPPAARTTPRTTNSRLTRPLRIPLSAARRRANAYAAEQGHAQPTKKTVVKISEVTKHEVDLPEMTFPADTPAEVGVVSLRPLSGGFDGAEVVFLDDTSSTSSVGSKTPTVVDEAEDDEDTLDEAGGEDSAEWYDASLKSSTPASMEASMPDIVQDANTSPLAKWLQCSAEYHATLKKDPVEAVEGALQVAADADLERSDNTAMDELDVETKDVDGVVKGKDPDSMTAAGLQNEPSRTSPPVGAPISLRTLLDSDAERHDSSPETPERFQTPPPPPSQENPRAERNEVVGRETSCSAPFDKDRAMAPPPSLVPVCPPELPTYVPGPASAHREAAAATPGPGGHSDAFQDEQSQGETKRPETAGQRDARSRFIPDRAVELEMGELIASLQAFSARVEPSLKVNVPRQPVQQDAVPQDDQARPWLRKNPVAKMIEDYFKKKPKPPEPQKSKGSTVWSLLHRPWDKPAVREKPETKDKPVIKEKPAVKEKPVLKEKPVTKDQPVRVQPGLQTTTVYAAMSGDGGAALRKAPSSTKLYTEIGPYVRDPTSPPSSWASRCERTPTTTPVPPRSWTCSPLSRGWSTSPGRSVSRSPSRALSPSSQGTALHLSDVEDSAASTLRAEDRWCPKSRLPDIFESQALFRPRRVASPEAAVGDRRVVDGRLVFLSSPPLATQSWRSNASTASSYSTGISAGGSRVLLCLSPSQRRCFNGRAPTPEECSGLLDMHHKFSERRAYHETPAPPPRTHSSKFHRQRADTALWIHEQPLGQHEHSQPLGPVASAVNRAARKVSAADSAAWRRNADADLTSLLALLSAPASPAPTASSAPMPTYVLDAGGKHRYEFDSDCLTRCVSEARSFSSILKDKLFWKLSSLADGGPPPRHTPPRPQASPSRVRRASQGDAASRTPAPTPPPMTTPITNGDNRSLYEDLGPDSPYWQSLARPKSPDAKAAPGRASSVPPASPAPPPEERRANMYDEYMAQVAERNRRRQQKVIKISDPETVTAARARRAHVDFGVASEQQQHGVQEQPGRADATQLRCVVTPQHRDVLAQLQRRAAEKNCVVIKDAGDRQHATVAEVQQLPKHLQEFLAFAKDADGDGVEGGVWSPGGPEDHDGDLQDRSSPTPSAPSPVAAVWTPRSAGASPLLERKAFRPVNFTSPQLSRKARPAPPAVDDGGPNGVAAAAALRDNAAPHLPRAPNPTVTLLQKAREGQIPRGAQYLDAEAEQRQSGAAHGLDRTDCAADRAAPEPDGFQLVSVSPRKVQGVGPTTREGLPTALRSELRDENKERWYKRMYDQLHKIKQDDDCVTVRYRPSHRDQRISTSGRRREGVSTQFKWPGGRTSGYQSEPELGHSDASKYYTLDRRRGPPRQQQQYETTPRQQQQQQQQQQHETTPPPPPPSSSVDAGVPTVTTPRSRAVSESLKYAAEVYKNQPGRIENYEPGKSSIAEKEAKQWWDEVLDIFDGMEKRNKENLQAFKPTFMTYALKESGYESDTQLVVRRREDGPGTEPLSPAQQRTAYKEIQKGGDVPLHGLRKTTPEKPKDPEPELDFTHGVAPVSSRAYESEPESPHRYTDSEVTIRYRSPVSALDAGGRPLSEQELSRRQAEAMRRLYQEERRRKYLYELQDINSRRHTDNFTPSQKSPIPLNRYDDLLDEYWTSGRSSTPAARLAAKALYNFVGQTPRELSFRRGDVILVKRQVDRNWYEGEHNGTMGLFPANYVEVLPYDHLRATPTKRVQEGQARARFNFIAQTRLELSLAKGELVNLIRRVDENWFEGRVGNQKGILPVSYVEVLLEPSERPATTPIPSGKPVAAPAAHSLILNGTSNGPPSMAQHSYQPPTSRSPANYSGVTAYSAVPAAAIAPNQAKPQQTLTQTLHVDTHSDPVPYRALYNYRPQNDDELELLEGDLVLVMEKCDDGWYVGSSQRTGFFGTFPGNYVERL